MKTKTMAVAALTLLFGATGAGAATVGFASTSDPSAWQVSTHVTGVDTYGDASRFLTGAADFAPAVQVGGRGDYIANNASGTNGWIGLFTQFVFRQTFDLSGFDPATATLQFQWAADDIPTPGYWDRGNWQPQFRLNGGAFQGAGTAWYDYTGTTVLSGGFVAGLNTIDFYVQGNGVTDGFELRTVSFTADPVPEPETYALMLAGLAGMALLMRWRRV